MKAQYVLSSQCFEWYFHKDWLETRRTQSSVIHEYKSIIFSHFLHRLTFIFFPMVWTQNIWHSSSTSFHLLTYIYILKMGEWHFYKICGISGYIQPHSYATDIFRYTTFQIYILLLNSAFTIGLHIRIAGCLCRLWFLHCLEEVLKGA